MILKIKQHNKSFVIIDKRPLHNPVMSLKAKGLLAYLLTLPDNWVVVVSELGNRFPDGRYAIAAALKELRDHGHATLEPVRDKDGRMAGKEWHIHERPVKNEPA
jgi:hypothetical protein